MKVRELIQKLAQCDPEADVFTYANEDCGIVQTLVRNGDALYFQADGYHRQGESHVYITDCVLSWLGSDAEPV